MNDEQKAWLEKVKAIIDGALAIGTPEQYESAVDALQAALDSCPEP